MLAILSYSGDLSYTPVNSSTQKYEIVLLCSQTDGIIEAESDTRTQSKKSICILEQ